jgi:dTDP-4-amino-4,6-dideoxygalactose transaminase
VAQGTQTKLAHLGGRPLRSAPFAPWPAFSHEELAAAQRVLESGKVNYWTGDEGRQFETEFASFAGCEYGVAVANGTVALELALHTLGIGPGDEVVIPSRTFIASASCVLMRGAIPVVADVDRDSQTITESTIRAVLSPRTRAIIAAHLAGWPCDMDPILELARNYGLKVVEDCAQAHGATYKGRPVGSMGTVGAFSFCQDKIMSTGGEGGMLTTNDPEIWTRAWAFKDHGKSYEAVYQRQHPPGYRWLHESLGTNWRLTEMQSAIGRVLLRKLPEFVQKRQRLAGLLTERLSGITAVRTTKPPEHLTHSFYKYYVFLRPEQLKDDWDRQRMVDAINAEGVPCFTGSCSEIYLEGMFPRDLRPSQRLPVARELGETAMMFLVHPTLSDGDMEDTASAIEKVLACAAK